MKVEEEILICAVRYALGRRSYIVGVVAEYVALKKKELSKYCVNILIRDIGEEIERYRLCGVTCGDECDDRTWRNLLKVLKEVE